MANYEVLDELIPKIQELHRAIFDKGYEQGFKDGANSEYEHDHEVAKAYNDGQAYVLDKVRADIEQEIACKPMEMWDYRMGLTRALNIIDKYRGDAD